MLFLKKHNLLCNKATIIPVLHLKNMLSVVVAALGFDWQTAQSHLHPECVISNAGALPDCKNLVSC